MFATTILPNSCPHSPVMHYESFPNKQNSIVQSQSNNQLLLCMNPFSMIDPYDCTVHTEPATMWDMKFDPKPVISFIFAINNKI